MENQPKRELGEEFEQICTAIRAGNCLIVLGEAGMGAGEMAEALRETFIEEGVEVAIAIYKGSLKKFFQTVAFQLDIPTTETTYNKDGEPIGEKQLTVDSLKEEILVNCGEGTLLILPEAKRLTTSIRYWLEDFIANGAVVVCFAAANPGRDIFLEMLEIELDLPSDRHIRKVMEAEAKKAGLKLSKSKLAELQPLAGRNPMLAKKIIRREKLGIKQDKVQHTQYVVIMPVIIAALMAFGVMRFIGLGTKNRGLYITGGICLVGGMALKQLGGVKGARKRLGQ